MKNIIYSKLRKLFLTRNYMKRIEKRMACFYPMREDLIRKKTAHFLLVSLWVELLALILLLSYGGWSVLYVGCSIWILLLLQSHLVCHAFEKEQVQLLKQFLVFISRFGSEYIACRVVSEAMILATDESHGAMNLQAQRLAEVLEEDQEEQIWQYILSAPNAYLSELAMVCFLLQEHGDFSVKGESWFLLNLNDIKEEAQEEILEIQKRKYSFQMLAWICLAPFFFLKPIELWAKSVSGGMQAYYTGGYEALTGAVIFVCIFLCFWLIHFFQFPNEGYGVTEKKSFGLFGLPYLEKIYSQRIYKKYAKSIRRTSQMQQAGYGTDLCWYHEQCILCGAIGFVSGFLLIGIYVSWNYGMLAAIVFMLVCGWLPKGALMIRSGQFKREKQRELIRLETVISLLMYQSYLTVEKILRYLELFADGYKHQLEAFEESYQMEVEERMGKNQKEDLEFEQLLEGLRACDKVSVAQAFSGITSQRSFHLKEQWNMRKQQLEDTAALAGMLAFIPLFVTIGLRLVIPFVVEGISQLHMYGQGFEQIL